ncbi:carbohydrate ABC transporter permease [Jidongwangia harbinensis]|uniref:carbohydrate ABC transporter permease n=1 Tax=Jidongwangia harbinensis TaxID=2878561 RepID=UPI001CDA3CE6|nr:carbohydrate ABC transporter permease [Jidongwangia harbinensis]MCA2219389.1 carbohydrate ABC transporter permease [Jidongwangia harbinensis]
MTLTAPPPPARTEAAAAPPGRRPRRRGTPGGVRTLVSAVDLNRHRTAYVVAVAGTMLVFTAAFLYPLYWMATSALKTPVEFAQNVPTIVPESFHPENYTTAWTSMRIGRFFLNTVYYALGGWLIQLILDVAVAYALSKLKPVFGRVVLAAMLASLMLPAAALLVPAYLTVADVPIFGWNLIDTPWALWLPAAANAFNVYVLKRFFDQIPNDLLDAAAIDGAGRLRILRSVVLPLSRPVLGVVSIFAIIGIWKDFLWPLLVLQDPEVQTLSVALSRLANTSQVPPTDFMAGLVIASVPMIVIFLIFQRSIIGGLSAGAMKG